MSSNLQPVSSALLQSDVCVCFLRLCPDMFSLLHVSKTHVKCFLSDLTSQSYRETLRLARRYVLLLHKFFFVVKNLAPTLPTMQRDHLKLRLVSYSRNKTNTSINKFHVLTSKRKKMLYLYPLTSFTLCEKMDGLPVYLTTHLPTCLHTHCSLHCALSVCESFTVPADVLLKLL